MPEANPSAIAPSWRWPKLDARVALALLGLCALIGLSMGVSVLLSDRAGGGRLPWSRPFAWELTSALAIWIALPVVQTAALNAPRPRPGLARFLALQIGALLLFSAVHVGLMLAARHGLYRLVGWGTYRYGDLTLRVPMELARDLTTYAATVSLWIFVQGWRDRQARALRAAQLEAELREARLRSLTGQLQPHFLFNALNTVSAVMYEDLARTDRLLANLAEILRATLDDSGPTWPLDRELEHVRRFVDVLTARFGDRLTVSWEVEPGLESTPVPRFALQLLVENAVKHNQDRREPLRVRVRALHDGGDIRLEVDDDGRGFALVAGPDAFEAGPLATDASREAATARGAPAHAGAGLGLAHLERVLALLHDGRGRVERGQGPQGGARVTLHLPG